MNNKCLFNLALIVEMNDFMALISPTIVSKDQFQLPLVPVKNISQDQKYISRVGNRLIV